MMSLLLQSPRNIRITEVSQQLSLQVRFILQRYHRGVGTSTRRAQYLVRSYRYLSNKPYDPIHDYSLSHNNEKSILVCGDGDLSFGASLSNGLLQSRPGVKLVASVLESQEQHNRVYKNSQKNIEIIRNNGHEVTFEVDATKLSNTFEHESFDRIQFNFPHWRGRTNNRRNRKLVSDFLSSSKDVLSPFGQIHLGLISHQGGMNAISNVEWKNSWKPAMYGGEVDLLLTHVLTFEPSYNRSAYQGRDKVWPTGTVKQCEMYLLQKCNNWNERIATSSTADIDTDANVNMNVKVPDDIQMFSYFTIFIGLPRHFHHSEDLKESFLQEGAGGDDDTVDDDLWTMQQALDEGFVQNMITSHLPEGIRTKSKLWRIHRGEQAGPWRVVEYRVVLFGEQRPITHDMAQTCKLAIEDSIQVKTVETKRGGWPASSVMPSSIPYSSGW